MRDGYSERTSISEVNGKEVVNFLMNRARGSSDLAVYDAALAREWTRSRPRPKAFKFIKLSTSTSYTPAASTNPRSGRWSKGAGAWRWSWCSYSCAIGGCDLQFPRGRDSVVGDPDLLVHGHVGGSTSTSSRCSRWRLWQGCWSMTRLSKSRTSFRHMRMGKSAYQASIDAADEIGLPVVATSFCIVAVFLPVGLMPGVSGQFFQNFGITVVIAVLMSLAVGAHDHAADGGLFSSRPRARPNMAKAG